MAPALTDAEPSTSSAGSSCSTPPTDDSGFGSELSCAVCGDSASGVHYDVPSCNGCKTFFRRTVTSGRQFTCKNGGTCKFDKDHRCSCRSCRFDQCVQVGMNPKSIQHNPSAKLILSIARKRFQRTKVNSGSSVPALLLDENHDVLQCISQALHLEEKADRLRNSNFFPSDRSATLEEVVRQPTIIANANKYSVVEEWPQRPDRIDIEDFRKKGVKFWFYNDLFMSVEFVKTFDAFQKLKIDDKLTLVLNSAIPHANMSSGYYAYRKKADRVIYPDGRQPFQHKDSLMEIEQVIRRGIVPYLQNLRFDQVQFSLLRVISFLNYTCPDLSDDARDILCECSKIYIKALMRYLQHKHGAIEGAKVFAESMAFLNTLYERKKYNYDYYAFRWGVMNANPLAVMFHEILTNRVASKN